MGGPAGPREARQASGSGFRSRSDRIAIALVKTLTSTLWHRLVVAEPRAKYLPSCDDLLTNT